MNIQGPVAPRSWLVRHAARLLLSLRILVACLLTFGAAHLLGLAQSYWAVLTAVIVMQSNVGGSIQAMIDRLLGSLGGAVWGVVVCLTIPHASVAGLGVALAIGVAPLAVASAFNPAWRIAPVTAIILLLTPTSQAQGPVVAAVQRMLEVGLGSVVAVIVALVLAPTRAQATLTQTARTALEAMSELVLALMAGLEAARDPAAVDGLHAKIRAAIAATDVAAADARRERTLSLSVGADPTPVARTLRRIHYDLVMIGRASLTPLPQAVRGGLVDAGSAAARAVAAFLSQSAAAIVDATSAPSAAEARSALAGFSDAVARVRAAGLARALPDDAVARLYGLRFALDQLGNDIGDLADRAAELVVKI